MHTLPMARNNDDDNRDNCIFVVGEHYVKPTMGVGGMMDEGSMVPGVATLRGERPEIAPHLRVHNIDGSTTAAELIGKFEEGRVAARKWYP